MKTLHSITLALAAILAAPAPAADWQLFAASPATVEDRDLMIKNRVRESTYTYEYDAESIAVEGELQRVSVKLGSEAPIRVAVACNRKGISRVIEDHRQTPELSIPAGMPFDGLHRALCKPVDSRYD